ncbi:hypothetical protein [Litorisediminicola beolgyonensis]|uniref:DUF3899 domain-containing protein n=1 Tax=Litorisediminicola beolgyonensis TaxID=1173614 RepID=A0ABW3ZDY9_9RHOB
MSHVNLLVLGAGLAFGVCFSFAWIAGAMLWLEAMRGAGTRMLWLLMPTANGHAAQRLTWREARLLFANSRHGRRFKASLALSLISGVTLLLILIFDSSGPMPDA